MKWTTTAAALSLVSVTAAAAAVGGEHAIQDARGVTISCWGWGHEWSTPDMRATMATLPDIGADWVTIHPYAHVSRQTGRVQWSADGRTDHVSKPIRWARELDLKIMIKPHISYWGEFDWRGDIGWSDEERWRRFRETYQGWIVHLAKVAEAEGADLFVVGTELRQSEQMRDWWRRVIGEVRGAYRGPITYAANWDDYHRVPFWRELDYIGVQAYFPLAADGQPSATELRAGWRRPVADMTRLSRAVGRPVILTEVGYPNASWAATTPWKTRRRGGRSELQEHCLRTALEVVHESDAIVGAFIWKWFPTTRDLGPGDFTVQTTPFKQLLADTWSRGIPSATVRDGAATGTASP